jgi:hypothetical protein
MRDFFRVDQRFQRVDAGSGELLSHPLRKMGHMARQLTLLDPSIDWRIDDRTREVGLRGIARARAALAAAHSYDAQDATPGPDHEHRPAA